MSMSKAEQQRYINELKGITVSQRAHATGCSLLTRPFSPQTGPQLLARGVRRCL